jgi:HEAT repeat protein
LKREYLNYLKWTEPLALMLELVEDEAQAVRVVRLALEVDLRLGARLAGAVKPEWQEQTVRLVAELEVSQLLKIQLLGITRSEKAIPTLSQLLEDEDWMLRWSVTRALGKINSEAAIPSLLEALKDENQGVCWQAVDALETSGSERTIPMLSHALKNDNPAVRSKVVDALETIGSETAIPALIEAWGDEDPMVSSRSLFVLGQIIGHDKISNLIQHLAERGFEVSSNLY